MYTIKVQVSSYTIPDGSTEHRSRISEEAYFEIGRRPYIELEEASTLHMEPEGTEFLVIVQIQETVVTLSLVLMPVVLETSYPILSIVLLHLGTRLYRLSWYDK